MRQSYRYKRSLLGFRALLGLTLAVFFFSPCTISFAQNWKPHPILGFPCGGASKRCFLGENYIEWHPLNPNTWNDHPMTGCKASLSYEIVGNELYFQKVEVAQCLKGRGLGSWLYRQMDIPPTVDTICTKWAEDNKSAFYKAYMECDQTPEGRLGAGQKTPSASMWAKIGWRLKCVDIGKGGVPYATYERCPQVSAPPLVGEPPLVICPSRMRPQPAMPGPYGGGYSGSLGPVIPSPPTTVVITIPGQNPGETIPIRIPNPNARPPRAPILPVVGGGGAFLIGGAAAACRDAGLDPIIANTCMIGGSAACAYRAGPSGVINIGASIGGSLVGSGVASACGASANTAELCGAYGSFGAGFVGGPIAGVSNGCCLVAGYAGELTWGLGSGFWNYGWDFGNALIGR